MYGLRHVGVADCRGCGLWELQSLGVSVSVGVAVFGSRGVCGSDAMEIAIYVQSAH